MPLNYNFICFYKLFNKLKIISILLLLFFINNYKAKAVGVLGNFSLAPTTITGQLTYIGGTAISVVFDNWIFSIGSYNAITRNIESDFTYTAITNEVFKPRLVNNFFEFDVEKLIPINKKNVSDEKDLIHNYGISLSGMFGLNHVKYRIVMSQSALLSESDIPNFGDCWYYSATPCIGFFYDFDKWIRIIVDLGYHFSFDANYEVKEVENVRLSNKDLNGIILLFKLQLGDVQ